MRHVNSFQTIAPCCSPRSTFPRPLFVLIRAESARTVLYERRGCLYYRPFRPLSEQTTRKRNANGEFPMEIKADVALRQFDYRFLIVHLFQKQFPTNYRNAAKQKNPSIEPVEDARRTETNVYVNKKKKKRKIQTWSVSSRKTVCVSKKSNTGMTKRIVMKIVQWTPYTTGKPQIYIRFGYRCTPERFFRSPLSPRTLYRNNWMQNDMFPFNSHANETKDDQYFFLR